MSINLPNSVFDAQARQLLIHELDHIIAYGKERKAMDGIDLDELVATETATFEEVLRIIKSRNQMYGMIGM